MAFCQSCGAQMSEGATVCTACGEAKSGRPYGSTPGMTPPSQYAPTATGAEVRGFLSSLFDLSFTSFITTKLIKVLYVLSLLGAALIALSVGVSGLNAGWPGNTDRCGANYPRRRDSFFSRGTAGRRPASRRNNVGCDPGPRLLEHSCRRLQNP